MILDAKTILQIETGTPPEEVELDILARRLPKADLHTHLGGAMRSSFVPHPPGTSPDRVLDYRGADHFFRTLVHLTSTFSAAASLTQATLRILEGAVDNGCRHVELSVQLAEFIGSSLGPHEILDAVAEAFYQMRHRVGLSGGIILATYRGEDSTAAIETVETALRARDRGVPVLGIGNDGPLDFALTEYTAAYALARQEKLRTTVHINVLEDVADGLSLPLDRVDHGIDMKGHPEYQEYCRREGIPATLCLSSTLIAQPGKYTGFEVFPLEEFRAAGMQVSLHTDDNALYFTDLAQEYRLATRAYDWDRRTLADVAFASLTSAWLEEENAAQRLTDWRREADALVLNPRMPFPDTSSLA